MELGDLEQYEGSEVVIVARSQGSVYTYVGSLSILNHGRPACKLVSERGIVILDVADILSVSPRRPR